MLVPVEVALVIFFIGGFYAGWGSRAWYEKGE